MRLHKHNLSHRRLLTCDMGQLVPIGLVEVLPGDIFQHGTSALIRLSPMQAPVMHPVTVRLHHFYVPHRLSWADGCGKAFEEFITGGKDGTDQSTIPTINTTGTTNDLFDYYGINEKVSGIPVSALPIRAFNLIFNEYFRDQDLVEERQVDDTTIPLIAWEKDYFTASRPYAQKGPDITLPIAGRAPVTGIGSETGEFNQGKTGMRETGGGTVTYTNGVATWSTNQVRIRGTAASDGFPDIYAELSSATAATIQQVREAFALQRFAEVRSRFGSRYVEYLQYLGISRPSDARLRRPEFLGGGKQSVQISEVLQTANEAGATTPRFGVGDLYGHGVAGVRGNTYRRRFEEHGYVVSLLSVRPRAMYTQGIHRTWLRQVRSDFWQKELEFIGQQEVLNNEIFADATTGNQTFGYADKYREYREHPSGISGEFRKELLYWHLGRVFESNPVLNQSFIDCKPSKRIFNEQTRHSLWIQVQHRLAAKRLVSRSAYAKII